MRKIGSIVIERRNKIFLFLNLNLNLNLNFSKIMKIIVNGGSKIKICLNKKIIEYFK
jgi:hypothetical protein